MRSLMILLVLTATNALADHPHEKWHIRHHGACCESNLAAEGGDTYVLAPILLNGNDIFRSSDGGDTWEKKYPPVDVSVPFGIEGDLHAWGDDVIYFGTELAVGVVARSEDRGENWTVVQVPVPFAANDQSWAYMGPMTDVCPLGQQTVPYVLMGWFRIGSVALFSCDGGLTWPIQTPLVGNNGNGPIHIICQTEALLGGGSGGDLRTADPNFAPMKAGRHGNWGPDKKMYWSETDGDDLYICNTDDFGVTWSGFYHPLPAGTPGGITVTLLAFDDNGTLYVMHAGRVYVSYDNGQSFAHTHVMPIWGQADTGDGGSAEFFVVENGIMHAGISTPGPGNGNTVWYLRGEGVDGANPSWHQEQVDVIPPDGNSPVRLDFMQTVIDDNGIVTLGYTDALGDTTTASRKSHWADSDVDGVLDEADNCPAVSNPAQADTDSDSVGDACDNCSTVINPDQCDTNGDLYGNLCDADLNNDGIVNSFDLSILRQQFGSIEANNDADLNCDGTVNSFDLSIMRSRFGGAPGPSGLVQ